MDFDALQENRCSNVGIAARLGDAVLLEKLLKCNAPLDVPDNRGWLPIHEAAFCNRTDFLRHLLLRKDSFNINFQAHDGTTALCVAAERGNHECCEILISNGADLNLGCNDNVRPLMKAVRCNSLSCVKLMIEHSCDVNAVCCSNWTAFHAAARDGYLDILKLLVDSNADAFVGDEHGRTPAFMACQCNRTECLKYLLEHCSDPKALVDTRALDGASCVYISCQEGYDDCLKILLSFNADVNLCTNDPSVHPIVPVAKNGYIRCMKILLPLINLNIVNDASEVDPVFEAAQEGHFDALKLLIDNGFPVNRKTEYYRDVVGDGYPFLAPLFSKTFATPLTTATVKHRLDIVELLLDSGARSSYANSNKVFSPLLFAIIRRNSPDILKAYLSRRSIDLNACPIRSPYGVPEALLASILPLYHDQLYLMLKSGLKPMMKRWCDCKQSSPAATGDNSFLKQLKSVLMPKDFCNTLRFVVQFESGLPNCCQTWQKALGDSWPDFIPLASNPPSLSHLSRLAVRDSMKSSVLFGDMLCNVLDVPKLVADYLSYKTT